MKLDRFNQIFLPALVAVSVLSVAPLKNPPRPRQIDPIPSDWRVPSKREVLRIGTEVLPSILTSPIATAVFWPPPIESMPTVASTALRFLAGGELETTWRLRDGARWSDGVPVSAEDLKFGFDLAPRKRLVDLAVLDPSAIVARYDDRLALALDPPALYPRHILDKAPGEGKAKADAMLEALRTQPLPSVGPYRVTEFKAKESLVAVANESFSGMPPSIARVEVHAADKAVLLDRFIKGELDYLTPNTLTPEQLRALAVKKPDAAIVRPSNILLVLQPDLGHPVLAVRDVRKALVQAIDRERIVKEIYGKAGRVAHAPNNVRGAVAITRNAAEATKTLAPHLAKLGGVPLHHSNFPVETRIAQMVAEDLEKAGLKVTLTPHDDVRPLFSKRDHKGLVVYALSGDRTQAPERFWNLPIEGGRYSRAARHDAFDADIADLCEREERALYTERREQLRDALFAQFSQRLPLLPLVFASERVAVDPQLRGWDGTTLEHWYFD